MCFEVWYWFFPFTCRSHSNVPHRNSLYAEDILLYQPTTTNILGCLVLCLVEEVSRICFQCTQTLSTTPQDERRALTSSFCVSSQHNLVFQSTIEFIAGLGAGEPTTCNTTSMNLHYARKNFIPHLIVPMDTPAFNIFLSPYTLPQELALFVPFKFLCLTISLPSMDTPAFNTYPYNPYHIHLVTRTSTCSIYGSWISNFWSLVHLYLICATLAS